MLTSVSFRVCYDSAMNDLSDGALPIGSLPQLISPYMQQLILETGGTDGPIGRQSGLMDNQSFLRHILPFLYAGTYRRIAGESES